MNFSNKKLGKTILWTWVWAWIIALALSVNTNDTVADFQQEVEKQIQDPKGIKRKNLTPKNITPEEIDKYINRIMWKNK